jgi:hypothetical protein
MLECECRNRSYFHLERPGSTPGIMFGRIS